MAVFEGVRFQGGWSVRRRCGIVIETSLLRRSEAGCEHVRLRRRIGVGICKMKKRLWARLEGVSFL